MMRTQVARMALAAALTTMSATAPAAPAQPWRNVRLSPDRRAALLVPQITRAEKLGLVFGYFGTEQAGKKYTPPAGARPGSAGYVPGIARLGIPPQWQTDAGIGVATQGAAAVKRERTSLPSGIATAATWNPELAHQGGAMIGDEAARSGFNVMLAGGVDLLRDPRNGRNFEYSGEDPLLAGTMTGAQIAGIQSAHVISTLKHYAINDQETDRDTGNSILDHKAARQSDLLAFQIAHERGDPGSVMCSYNKVDGVHSCENRWLLTDVLRTDWGFRGFVMSDWGATHSTVAAANAGLEQDSGFPFDKEPYFGAPLAAAVERGDVSEARLTQMATRILRGMFANGLFEHPVGERPIDYAAHAAVTRADISEGAVLLRNEGAILPLSPSVRSIAVIGGHADKGVLAGSGSSLVYPRGGNAVPGIKPLTWPGPVMYHPSAPLAAIRAQAPAATVRFASGEDRDEAVRLARDSEVVILFGTQWSGESFDVKMTLDDDQDALVAAVAAANPKTVVVLENNAPILMPWADRTAAILEAWYPGTEGGAAIADLLFGRVNPSGHLPATVPASLEQLANPAEPKAGDVRYPEGATVGYKWFDARGLSPRYAFGHGLSYTSFAFDRLSAARGGGGITARFRARNTGQRAGKAVPQVYVSAPAEAGWEAPKRLGGWQKLALAPGAAKNATVAIDPRLLATWDEAGHRWRIAPGSYRVTLAASARDPGETVSVTLPAQTLPATWRPVTKR